MSLQSPPVPEEHVPTFYLEGQPYCLSADSDDLPAELADEAVWQTRRAYWRMMALYLAGKPLPEDGVILDEHMWLFRATELAAGMALIVAVHGPIIKRAGRFAMTIASGIFGVQITV